MSKFTFAPHVTAHAKAETKTAGLMAKACDAMVADNIGLAMFSKKTDASDRAEDFRNALKAAIVAAFAVADRKLLDTPTKGLSDKSKERKRYMQMQVGARVNDYKRGLDRRLNGPAQKGADQKRTDDRTFCEERLVAIRKRVEKAEEPGFDVVKVLAHVDAALSAIQAKI